jgi:hypothetical protein
VYRPWQNQADGEIRELKKGIFKHSRRRGSPKQVWCYCGEWVSGIRRLVAHDTPALDGRVQADFMSGDTPDISEYCQFDCYQGVWFTDPKSPFQSQIVNLIDGLE